MIPRRLLLVFTLSVVSGHLHAAESTLTKKQVKEIAALVVEREHKTDDSISEPQFNSETGIWSCLTLTGLVHGQIFVEIRDADRHYRTFTYGTAGKKEEFRLRTSLRRRIAKIAPIK